MISRKTRTIAATIGSAALMSGIALAGAPAANAAPERSPEREATMAFPLGGEHRMIFEAFAGCHYPDGKGNGPTLQTITGAVRDLDQKGGTEASLSMDAFLPFNTVRVDWKNLATGQTGSNSADSQGNMGAAEVPDTGWGDIEVTVTMTRSLLPSFGTGSVMPGAAQHSETFVLANEYDTCHSE